FIEKLLILVVSVVVSLLLKVFQSALDKNPFCMPLACLTSMVDPVPNTAPVPPVIVNIEDPVSDKLLMERSRGTPADPVLFPLMVLAGMSDNLAFVTAASVIAVAFPTLVTGP